jgi:hypothetical protein
MMEKKPVTKYAIYIIPDNGNGIPERLTTYATATSLKASIAGRKIHAAGPPGGGWKNRIRCPMKLC